MTFDSLHVEFYMTKFSFLTVFVSVCVNVPRGAIFNRFCAVFMRARKERAVCLNEI